MRIVEHWFLLFCSLLVAASCVAPGASSGASPSAQGLTPEIAKEELIDLSPIPSSLSPARVDDSAASTTAQLHAMGGPNAGPVTEVVHARAQPNAGEPSRTVWVVMFGPGGTVPVPAIAASAAPSKIVYQGVIVDDQTGEYLRGFISSTP